jgi:putative redox protein
MVQIDITYTGNLNCEAVHEPSGTKLTTGAPKDNQGDGLSFSPTDLVATALGTCIVTTMAIAARKHGIELAGTTVRVQKEMSSAPRRIARLPVEVWVNTRVAPEFRERLEAAGRACPVHKTVDHDTEMPITFHWKD